MTWHAKEVVRSRPALSVQAAGCEPSSAELTPRSHGCIVDTLPRVTRGGSTGELFDERAEDVAEAVRGDGSHLGPAVEQPSNRPLGYVDVGAEVQAGEAGGDLDETGSDTVHVAGEDDPLTRHA